MHRLLPLAALLLAALPVALARPPVQTTVAQSAADTGSVASAAAMSDIARDSVLIYINYELREIKRYGGKRETPRSAIHFTYCCAEGFTSPESPVRTPHPEMIEWKALLEQLQENPELVLDRSLRERFTLQSIRDWLDLMYLLANREQPQNLFTPPVPFIAKYPFNPRETVAFCVEMDLRYLENFLDDLNAGTLNLPPEGEPLRPIDASPQLAHQTFYILREKMPADLPAPTREKLKAFMRRFATTPDEPNLKNLYENLEERQRRLHPNKPTERVEDIVENITNWIIIPQDTFASHVQANPDYYPEYLQAMQVIALATRQNPAFNYRELPEAGSFPPDLAEFIQLLDKNTMNSALGTWNLTEKGLELRYTDTDEPPEFRYEQRLQVLLLNLEMLIAEIAANPAAN